MPLLLGQLVYTTFPKIGLRTLASPQVPIEIQQAFIQSVVYQYWDSYTPKRSGYRAAYLHQITPEHNLFGWLYNDGEDDINRMNVPYFICYYLAELLHAVQLENIFTCMHKGPVALIDRHSPPTSLETIVVRNFWSYQPASLGVAIPLDIRKRNHIALKQGNLLDLFVPVKEIELNVQTYEQQRIELSIYTDYLAEGIEAGIVDLNEDTAIIEAEVTKPYRGHTDQKTKAIRPLAKFVAAIKTVLLFMDSQLLLKTGIAVTVMTLIGGFFVGWYEREGPGLQCADCLQDQQNDLPGGRQPERN